MNKHVEENRDKTKEDNMDIKAILKRIESIKKEVENLKHENEILKKTIKLSENPQSYAGWPQLNRRKK